MYTPAMAGRIINACAVLHNIMLEEKYPLPKFCQDKPNGDGGHSNNNDAEDGIPIDASNVHIRLAGFRARDVLINNYF